MEFNTFVEESLKEGKRVIVMIENNIYEIVAISGGEITVLINGGRKSKLISQVTSLLVVEQTYDLDIHLRERKVYKRDS